MKLQELKPNQLTPDNLKLQVIEKIDALNERLKSIRHNMNNFEDECVYEKELKWINGYYCYTDVPVSNLYKDVKRIKFIENCIEFYEFIDPKLMFDKKIND